MTQILTALTPDIVVMVADRRLTDLASGNLIDDEACKLVALGSQAAVGFTGPANVRPPPRGQTDFWLTDVLTPPPDYLEEIIDAIGHSATKAFGKITHLGPRAERHAFVIAGWQALDESTADRADFRPFYVTISNAQGADSTWRERASDHFETHGWALRGRRRCNAAAYLRADRVLPPVWDQ